MTTTMLHEYMYLNPLQIRPSYTKALTWGTTKKIQAPSNLTLSLVTCDKRNGILDIEAPTKLDRDKFAKAFSVFLKVPLDEDLVGESVNVNREPRSNNTNGGTDEGSEIWRIHTVDSEISSIRSESTCTTDTFTTPTAVATGDANNRFEKALLPMMTPSPTSSASFRLQKHDFEGLEGVTGGGAGENLHARSRASDDLLFRGEHNKGTGNGGAKQTTGNGDDNNKNNNNKQTRKTETFDLQGMESTQPNAPASQNPKPSSPEEDTKSDVSSLTQGFNQEIVEELHCALNELRAELESSRAEAARAVKVAEQAIQSAESCSSNDWNSTVTHKAAEAAARAERRSAEAIAKQRTAEVQRLAVQDDLESQKIKAGKYIQVLKRDFKEKEEIQKDTMVSVTEQNRLLEVELDGTRRDLDVKGEQAKALQDSILEIREGTTELNRTPIKKKILWKSRKEIPQRRCTPTRLRLPQHQQHNKYQRNPIASTGHEMRGSPQARGRGVGHPETVRNHAQNHHRRTAATSEPGDGMGGSRGYRAEGLSGGGGRVEEQAFDGGGA